MALSRRMLALAVVALGIADAAVSVRRAARADAPLPEGTPAAELLIVATPHDPAARASEVRAVVVGASGLREQALGQVPHAARAVIRGDVLAAERSAVLVADEEDAADPDYGSALFRIDATGTRRLARGVYHASRPLVGRGGEVFVERGERGPDASPGSGGLRVDTVRIDAIDPVTGDARALHVFEGYTAHLAGELGADLLVYRVSKDRADIAAIHRATGQTRVVAEIPPFARDFSVDEVRGALVMTNRDDHDPRVWTVETLDVASGARSRATAQQDDAPAPFALGGGALAWSHGRLGLVLRAEGGEPRLLSPLGPGFHAVTHASPDGAWLTVFQVPSRAGAYDTSAALHLASGTALHLSSGDERVEVLGFASGRGGLR